MKTWPRSPNAHNHYEFTLVLAQRRSLDLISLGGLLRGEPGVRLLGLTACLRDALKLCHELLPDIALLDAGFPNGASLETAQKVLQKRWARGVILLDDEVRLSRAIQATNTERTCYYSKHVGFQEILYAMRRLCAGKVSHDPSIRKHLIVNERDDRFRLRIDGPSVVNLTEKEIEVMRLLALGSTVREAAEQLQLAVSTVDNHKTRIMKKLDVRKTTRLTHIAIRDGLIDDWR